MNDFLDRFVRVHRLGTFQAARRWATRRGHAADDPQPAPPKAPAPPVPYQESIMIMRHGKKHWREWKASGAPICPCCERSTGMQK